MRTIMVLGAAILCLAAGTSFADDSFYANCSDAAQAVISMKTQKQKQPESAQVYSDNCKTFRDWIVQYMNNAVAPESIPQTFEFQYARNAEEKKIALNILVNMATKKKG